jgi:hypothetical protein
MSKSTPGVNVFDLCHQLHKERITVVAIALPMVLVSYLLVEVKEPSPRSPRLE